MTTTAAVDTRKMAGRRDLSFSSLDDMLADVNRLDAGERRAIGNWTPAQVVDHLSMFIEGGLDGINVRASLPMRIMGKLMKKSVLTKGFRPGFKIPDNMKEAMPDPGVTWADALARFHRAMDRINGGERMTQASPFLGPLTHEEWVALNCRHGELHLSFVQSG